jgi:hypothetical protein
MPVGGLPGRAPRRRLRTVLLALLPLVALLALSESVLWLAGAGDPAERRALRGGFDENRSYLVPDPDVPGGWRTQMFAGDDEGHPEVIIPPRGAGLRVLLFGGSNTEGFPADYVREQLAAALRPEPAADEVEVINLGRHGYGSERVHILFRQALVLQPDVALVYMGHNEFVERGFAMELTRQWDSPWQATLADGLSRLRTLNVTVSALEHLSRPAAGSGGKPEPRAGRGPEFDALTRAEVERFFDHYRRRYAEMLELAADAGVEVLLCTVIGNDFHPPIRMNVGPEVPPARLQAGLAARGRALASIPRRYLPGLVQTRSDDPPIHLRVTDWGEGMAPERLAARRQAGAGRAGPVLRTLRAPLDGGPFWTGPEQWSSDAAMLLDTFAAVVARAPTAAERSALRKAIARFDEAGQLLPGHAYTLFEQGLCTYVLGAPGAGRADGAGGADGADGAESAEGAEGAKSAVGAEAERLLRAAAVADCSPTRGNDLSNGIVRELAAAHPACAFVDTEEWMRSCMPDRLIGYEVMMDNCHMHAKVLPHVMDLFVPHLAELGRRALDRRGR